MLAAIQRGNRDDYCMMMGPDDQFNAEQVILSIYGNN